MSRQMYSSFSQMVVGVLLFTFITVMKVGSLALVDRDAMSRGGVPQETFAVAPMMGHTNRHYHTYFHSICPSAHLYTEMIPASQIVQAYERAATLLYPRLKDVFHPHCIVDVVQQCQQQKQHKNAASARAVFPLLHLLRITAPQAATKQQQVHLQIGGRDGATLAKAAAIGAAMDYASVNLNCGCPSSAVSGRAGGASWMKPPLDDLVTCLAQMAKSMHDIADATGDPPKVLSVKHRLGIRSFSSYNAENDRRIPDKDQAIPECRQFVQAIIKHGHVSKLHIHARIALLEDEEDLLWVPGRSSSNACNEKINHSRVQAAAIKKARQRTLDNRSVPPLRPGVVQAIAQEFPHLDILSNGGIQDVEDVQDRLSCPDIHGVMVGRAAINHPCSFSRVHTVRGKQDVTDSIVLPTRGQVLEGYMEYCMQEEAWMKQYIDSDSDNEMLQDLTHRLVAVPFHLFVGFDEESSRWQRRIRKLVQSSKPMSAASILRATLQECVSPSTLERCVGDFDLTPDDATHDKATRRAGRLQSQIY